MPTPAQPEAESKAPAVASRRKRGWRRLWWLGAAGGLILAALGGTGAWLLGTQSGLDRALAFAHSKLDGAVQLEGARGRLLGPLQVDRLRYHSADLQVAVEDVELQWRPASLFSRDVSIARLSAARVDVAQRPGNEEAAPAQAPDSLELPFSLRVDELAVGEFVLRTLPGDTGETSASAVLYSFKELNAALDSNGRRHRIEALTLSLPQGRVALSASVDGQQPFALDLQGGFAGSVEGHALQLAVQAGNSVMEPEIQLDGDSDGIVARIEARLETFAQAPLRALKLHASEIDPAAFVATAPSAAFVVDAALAAPAAGEGLLAGPIRIENRRPGTIDAGGLPLTGVAGTLHWKSDEIVLEALDLSLPDKGRIGGRIAWKLPQAMAAAEQDESAEPEADGAVAAATPIGQLFAALQLKDIDLSKLDSRLPAQILAGRVDAEGDAGRQHAEVELGLGKAQLSARAELAQLEASSVRQLDIRGKLRALEPAAFIAGAPPARLNLDFDGSGELPAEGLPQAAKLSFRIADSHLRGKPVAGEGRLTLAGERLPEVALKLQLAGNRLDTNGAWGAAGDALAVRLDAPDLAALELGLAGKAKLDGVLRGTLAVPAGELKFSADGLRLPGDVRLLGARGDARLDAGAEGPFRLAVDVRGLGPAARDADGLVQPDWVSTASVRAEGRRDAHRIELEVAAPPQDGKTDRVRARLDGGLKMAADGGAPRWVGELLSLASEGRFPARLEAPAALELGSTAVRLGAAEVQAGARGRIRLSETSWSPQRIVARGSLSGLVVDTAERPRARSRGPGPLTLGANWDLSLGETLAGEARVFRESGDIRVEGELSTRLGLETLQAVLTAQGDRLAVAVEAVGSEFGRLGGTASLRAQRSASGMWSVPPEAALQGAAQLDMPSITWLGRLMQENVETAGEIKGAFTIGGTVAAPAASGSIEGRKLQLALVDQGLQLSGGEFDLSFSRDRLRLDRLSFVSPNRVKPRDSRIPLARLTATPGTLTGSGELALDSGAGQFSFAADRLPLLQREDRWMILSGSGSATTSWTSLRLDADFRADAGYLEFAESLPPSLSDDVVVLGRDEVRPEGGFAVEADVRVGLGDALYLSALGLESRLEGELRLRLRPGLPLSAVGTVATVGGSYRGYGQALAIDRGVVNFQGPLDAPGLNIVALRKGLAVEAGVAVSGSARRPQVRLVSEPNVPDPEKLSWIVLGRAPDAASGADLGLLLPAAQALLGGPGGGMTDALSRSLGFDSFSIGQGDLNSTSRTATSRVVGGGSTISSGPSVSGQVLSLGKRLSSDLFLSFEQSLSGAETLVKLTYQLSRRVSLIARGGTDNSVDLNYSFSFR